MNISFPTIERTVVNHDHEFKIPLGHIIKNYGNIIQNQVTFGDPNFEPKLWCDRQWSWLTSSLPSDNYWLEVVTRVLMLIPLLFASIIAYPVSCCIFSVQTSQSDDLDCSLVDAAGIQITKTLFFPTSCTQVIFDSPGILEIKIQNIDDEKQEIANQIKLEATYDENLDSTFKTAHNDDGHISIVQKKDCLSSKPAYTLTMPLLTKLHVMSVGSVNIDSKIKADTFTLSQTSTGMVIINSIEANELRYNNKSVGSTLINQMNIQGIFHCTLESCGNISINDIHAETLVCNINSTGNVNPLAGTIINSTVSIASSGSFLGSEINATASHVKITGSGKAYFNKEPSTKTITGSGKCIVGTQKIE